MSTGINMTVYTFTVLHRTDEPFHGDTYYMGPFEGSELGEAMTRAYDGNAVGIEQFVQTTEVQSAEDVRKYLIAMGNDGEFFDDQMEADDGE